MFIKKIYLLLLFAFFFNSCSDSQYVEAGYTDEKELVLSGKRLTFNDYGSKAFTDLVFFENRWFLTYRESDLHIFGKNGKVKIFSSIDGVQWYLDRQFDVSGVDLRDPKFSVNKNSLTIYMHGSVYEKTNLVGFRDYISQWKAGKWSDYGNVMLDNNKLYISQVSGNESWPWRVTWYGDKAYVFGYHLNGIFGLYTSADGTNFVNINSYFDEFGGEPNEATIRINDLGDFYALVRRQSANALLLKSSDKGLSWKIVSQIPIMAFGGPNFQFYKSGLILSGRDNGKVALAYFDLKNNQFKRLVTLVSGGDCSYAGMVIKDEILWISYYSGHETKMGSSIYLEMLNLNEFSF